ncbi:CoA transferase [Amylibacter sp.]|jgi:crotonobetainyl-CoA:carnitine CoA-transferase CaiB-like acyl-CoA transferase|nr:CoA transferase [Amylibacter sp.]MDA8913587.1 CoA transferase [Amylibacter sp.]MDA9313350.1 CoA transferase [Amylibacter sp.]MDB2320679.1 CoA transferase [Amylibacter sp.]|tara:strand:- start:6779 stop:7906 length:1128 start_codon:yes stop_codon:yes gene_type:complete
MTEMPLKGIRVIELARILAGPWAGQTLADLGAEVIKIESKTGDDTRTWGPPFIKTEDESNAAYYHSCNRGKHSVSLDFNDEDDLLKLKTLIATADILIENFKVGGLDKYGLDYTNLRTKYPSLIYCSITGFGQTGPYAKRAGYDFLMQGMSGLMSITGEPEGQPQKVGVAVTDIFTGLYAVIAVQAALRTRDTTGFGQHIDLSLLDVATATTANQAMNYLTTGISPNRKGNNHPNIVPYCAVPTSDGHIILAVGNDSQFENFSKIFNANWYKEDKYKTNPARLKNRDELLSLIEENTTNISSIDLLSQCENFGVPAGPINTIEDVFNDPQILHRGMKIDLNGVPSVKNPIIFSDIEMSYDRPSPNLGEANKKFLK